MREVLSSKTSSTTNQYVAFQHASDKTGSGDSLVNSWIRNWALQRRQADVERGQSLLQKDVRVAHKELGSWAPATLRGFPSCGAVESNLASCSERWSRLQSRYFRRCVHLRSGLATRVRS